MKTIRIFNILFIFISTSTFANLLEQRDRIVSAIEKSQGTREIVAGSIASKSQNEEKFIGRVRSTSYQFDEFRNRNFHFSLELIDQAGKPTKTKSYEISMANRASKLIENHHPKSLYTLKRVKKFSPWFLNVLMETDEVKDYLSENYIFHMSKKPFITICKDYNTYKPGFFYRPNPFLSCSEEISPSGIQFGKEHKLRDKSFTKSLTIYEVLERF